MPDIAVCNSTVCPVRKNCERNWDSGVHQADRDPAVQEWAGQPEGVRTRYDRDTRTHDVLCPHYLPLVAGYRPDYVSSRGIEIEEEASFLLSPENRAKLIDFVLLLHTGKTAAEATAPDDIPVEVAAIVADIRRGVFKLRGNIAANADGVHSASFYLTR